MNSERVLCINASALETVGRINGISYDAKPYVDLLNVKDGMFVRRDVCETDLTLKQIIPFMILRNKHGKIFRYMRGGKSGESRLVNTYEIGVGGHVQDVDETYEDAAFRELKEEVGIILVALPDPIAVVNWDLNDVGRVHLGYIHVIDVAGDGSKDDHESDVIKHGAWFTLEELSSNVGMKSTDVYGAWAKVCVDNIEVILALAKVS